MPIAAAAASACITSAWQQQYANDGYNMIQPKATQNFRLTPVEFVSKGFYVVKGASSKA